MSPSCEVEGSRSATVQPGWPSERRRPEAAGSHGDMRREDPPPRAVLGGLKNAD